MEFKKIKYKGKIAYKHVDLYEHINLREDAYRLSNNILRENNKKTDSDSRPNNILHSEDKHVFSCALYNILIKVEPDRISLYQFLSREDFKFILEQITPLCNEYSIKEELKKIKLLMRATKKPYCEELKKGNTVLRIGTNLYTCWGYDQTNTELYKVVSIIGKNYFLVMPRRGELDQNSFMSGTLSPSNEITTHSIPIKCYISNDGFMSVCESGYKRGLYIERTEQQHAVSWGH